MAFVSGVINLIYLAQKLKLISIQMKNGKIFNNLRSSKGRTIGFGPINEGSSPSPIAKLPVRVACVFKGYSLIAPTLAG